MLLTTSRIPALTEAHHMRRGTLPFMAPELVNDPERITEKADCWSFGMLCWELLTLQSPFQDLPPNTLIGGLMVRPLICCCCLLAQVPVG